MSESKPQLAVVIGINEYAHPIPELKTPTEDAEKLAEILSKHKYKVLKLNKKGEATKDKLISLIGAFKEQKIPFKDGFITVEPDDQVLFYFAGHGILSSSEDVDESVGYLIPQDGEDRYTSWLRMEQLREALNNLRCRHLLVILDCCFAGAFIREERHRNFVRSQKVYKESYKRFVDGYARQVITSAASDEKAVDFLFSVEQRTDNNAHSPFAELLFKALEGEARNDMTKDKIITATELYTYLREELGKKNVKQTPLLRYLKGHDKGEYIFTLPGFNKFDLDSAGRINPYKGLKSFEKEDSEFFFGREASIEKLRTVVAQQPLTVVMGASGSGKSSLVKAGLVPRLTTKLKEKEKESQEQWYILSPIRPGKFPLSALNSVVTQKNLPVVNIPGEAPQQNLKTLVESVLARQNLQNSKLLLIIDQCEELVTLCQNDQEQERFLSSLGEALIAYPEQLRIVLTLRSRFEPQFSDTALKIETLKPYWKPEARFVVPAMTPEELRQVIEEPAAARAVYFESPELVNKLIDEVEEMPGVLPLFSFALHELYDIYLNRTYLNGTDNRTITQTDYEELCGKELGGVTRSLFQKADQVYKNLVEESKQAADQTIRHVMLRMVDVVGGELVRRPVPFSELDYPEPKNQQVKAVIGEFLAANLIVEGQDDYEPAHDALVQQWQKILAWKKEEQESLILQRRLTPAAFEWKKSTQEARFLWNSSPYLDLLNKVLDSPDNWFNKTEAEFVQHSVRQRRKNKIGYWSLVTGGLVVLSGATIAALFQRNEAIQNKLSRLAPLSETRLANNDQLGALLAGVKAGVQLKQAPWLQDQFGVQTTAALQQAVYGIQERNRLEGNTDPVYGISFNPNGKTIATANWDKTVKLWATDGTLLKTFKGHTDEVNAVTFSRDGKLIASGGKDKTVNVWRVNDGALLKTFQGHSAAISGVSFSLDGEAVASASEDGTVKLWTIYEGKLIKTLQSHNGQVKSVSFSPDGKLIASGGWDNPPWKGKIKLWSLDGTLLNTFDVDTGVLRSINFSNDGKTIVASGDNGSVKLLQIADGKLLKDIKAHDAWVMGATISRDGQTIASVSIDKTVKLWTVDGRLLKVLPGHNDAVYGVAFSPNGKTLATASADKTVRLWSVDGSSLINLIQSLDGEQGSAHLGVSFSPDGKTLASASWDATEGDWTVKLWSTSGKLLKTLVGYGNSITTVTFNRDGKYIASASWDGRVKVWTIEGELLTEFTEHGKPVNGMTSHPDGTRAAVNGVSFSPDSKILASVGYDRNIRLWHLDGTPLRVIPNAHSDQIYRVSFSPDGKTLATASWDRTVKIWSFEGKLLQTFTGHGNWLYGLSFSPNGKLLASAGLDRTVRLWNIEDGKLLKSWIGHNDGIRDVSFSPDGKRIASASLDKTVKLWSVDGTLLKIITGHNGEVYGLSFSPDSQTIASASWDGSIKLWKAETLKFQRLLEHGCKWLHDYLKTNPNAKEDRHLCDGIRASRS
jgi:WD40 repeat protein/energy-coupling factor transporter ATP-binding protein EcfA2